MGDDLCMCRHTRAWHMAESRFTTRHYCMVTGCYCQDFKPLS